MTAAPPDHGSPHAALCSRSLLRVNRMRAHPPEVNLTEFLAKSLVTTGVFLAIPAALSAAAVTFMLWGTWPYDAWSYLGWLAFCGIGFFLLHRSVRIVRAPE